MCTDRPLIQSGTRVAIVAEPDVPALLLQRVARIRPRDELQSEFLALLLAGKSFADYPTPIFTGISVPHLCPEQIKSFRFALPTDDEQVMIAESRPQEKDVLVRIVMHLLAGGEQP